ncbi:transcription initiation factor iia subunit 1 [Populus alba x Populus x berolinensis]|nr:transcription initiation factor iia subunit 1 [Populus alba x Populus x berolinensis]
MYVVVLCNIFLKFKDAINYASMYSMWFPCSRIMYETGKVLAAIHPCPNKCFSIYLISPVYFLLHKGLACDGPIYNYQGVANEDYNIANTPAPNDLLASTPAVVSQNDVADDDDDDEPLNEDDDDDEDLDDVDQGEELNTQHLVLAQFDKVTRTKSKWKCILKDGIMHINNKDILFNKATGEFDF